MKWKRSMQRALGPLLTAMRCTRGTSAVTYLMVTGLVALVAAPAFQRFDTRTSTAIEDRSGLVAQLDGTEAQHADSLPGEIAGATESNLVNAFEDGQLVVNAIPYLAYLGVHGLAHEGDDPQASRDPALRDPPGGPEDPRTGLPCEGDSCPVGSGQCFIAGTEVATPFGPRPIESLSVGDVVWSHDDAPGGAAAARSNELAARNVVRTFVTPDREIVDVSVVGEDGTGEMLHATPQHPFHVAGIGWRAAGALASGDRIDTYDGRMLEVVAEATHATRETVYNLEVEGLHTYFVGVHRAWVHNSCDETPTGKEVVPWRPENPNAEPWQPKSWYWKEMPGNVNLHGTDESGNPTERLSGQWYEQQVRDFYGGMDKPPALDASEDGKGGYPIRFTGEKGTQRSIQPDVQTRDGSMVGDAKMRKTEKNGWFEPNAIGSLEKLYIWANRRGWPNAELALITSREVPTDTQNAIKKGLADWLGHRGLSNDEILAVLHRVAFRHIPAAAPPGY
jgi:hypothetical protein